MFKRIAFVALFGLLAAAPHAHAQGADIQIERTAQPPKIDGVLNDEVWKRAPLPAADRVSYQPVRGDKMAAEFRTEASDRNIYFAFHCFDNEPAKMRTNVSRRDSSFSDVHVGVSGKLGITSGVTLDGSLPCRLWIALRERIAGSVRQRRKFAGTSR